MIQVVTGEEFGLGKLTTCFSANIKVHWSAFRYVSQPLESQIDYHQPGL